MNKEVEEKIFIDNTVRVNQLRAIDLYIEAAKEDESLIKFLETIKTRIEIGLEGTSEEEK